MARRTSTPPPTSAYRLVVQHTRCAACGAALIEKTPSGTALVPLLVALDAEVCLHGGFAHGACDPEQGQQRQDAKDDEALRDGHIAQVAVDERP